MGEGAGQGASAKTLAKHHRTEEGNEQEVENAGLRGGCRSAEGGCRPRVCREPQDRCRKTGDAHLQRTTTRMLTASLDSESLLS